MTVVEHSRETPGFGIFLEALEKTNLADAFDGSGQNTLLAPTDAAFKALLAKWDITKGELLERPDLVSIVEYHIVKGTKLMNDGLYASQQVDTLSGDMITVTKVGGEVRINGVLVQYALECTDGVLEVLEDVLIPPASIMETLAPQGLTILAQALQQFARLQVMLSGPGPFTLFAPTNAAFEVFFARRNVTGDELSMLPDLKDLLEYHLIMGLALDSASMMDGGTAAMMNGDQLVFFKTVERTAMGGATLVIPDIDCSNGVLHVVDAVLLPPTTTSANLAPASELDTSNSIVSTSLGLGSLLAAVEVAKLFVGVD